jgi:hypothetical protein
MAKVLPFQEGDKVVGYYFNCPGCKDVHAVHIRPNLNSVGAGWTWNENVDSPTFSPSILCQIHLSNGSRKVCHLFVQNGQIRFLEDSTHPLAGKSIDMEDMEN